MREYKVILRQFLPDTENEAPFIDAIKELATVEGTFYELDMAKAFALVLCSRIKNDPELDSASSVCIKEIRTIEEEIWRDGE